MTPDHLEPYRQMARSIRFVPPLQKRQASQQALIGSKPISLPIAPNRVSLESHAQTSIASTPGSIPIAPVDPSEHAVQLIQSAVSQPTALPPIFVLPEGIGDRISRLVAPAPTKPAPILFSPKIPEPGSVMDLSVTDPTIVDPVTTDPVTTDPIVTDPVTTDPIVTDPVTTDSTVTDPVTTDPTVTDLTSTESIEPVSQWLESMTSYMEHVTQQLEQTHEAASHRLVCPHCSSANVHKNGRRAGKQKYACEDCSRQFTSSSPAGFDRSNDKAATGSKSTKNSAKPAAKQRSRGFGAQMKNR